MRKDIFMNLKTIIKTLCVMFSISYILSPISFPLAHAVKSFQKVHSDETFQVFTITVSELKENCTIAERLFIASDQNPEIYIELKRCCEIYDAFQICEPSRIATISEIKEALKTATYYFRRTGDKKFIHHIKSYIKKNHIAFNKDEALGLLKFTILLEDGCDGFVRFLITKCHVDVNSSDRDGNTPLHIAASYCRNNMVRLLLHHKANFRVVDATGKTPCQIAAEHAHIDPCYERTVDIFKEYFKKHHIKS